MKIFWSWQSDLPGNISRHFVKEALAIAINSLKREPDIEEAVREAELDYDRKGVPGSPDLAATIFGKIDNCHVFVADVTPVGYVIDNKGKRLINSNVAIEFGYALRARGDRSILMVMNEAYGSIDQLPFDLRHKAGPITYRLVEGATREDTAAQRAVLAGAFKTALRAMVPTVAKTTDRPIPETKRADDNPGRYFAKDEVLVTRQGIPLRTQDVPLKCTADSILYMRIIPTSEQPELSRADAMTALIEGNLNLLNDRASGQSKKQNRYGVIVFASDADDKEIVSATQLFRNREIWGFDTYVLSPNIDPVGIPTGWHEYILALALKKYLAFAKERLQLTPPLVIEIGATNVEGHFLLLPHKQTWGPIHEQHVICRQRLDSFDPAEADRLLLAAFQAFFDAAGARRPGHFNKFPGDPAGTLPS